MKQKKKSDVAVLLDYAGSHRGLTYLGLFLSAVSMLLSMAPYICIWLVARDLIAVAPDWTQAENVTQYGWLAFAFALGGIVIYFAALMCTHLAAFRTAANIRKRGVAHVMKAPLGYFDANASGWCSSNVRVGREFNRHQRQHRRFCGRYGAGSGWRRWFQHRDHHHDQHDNDHPYPVVIGTLILTTLRCGYFAPGEVS